MDKRNKYTPQETKNIVETVIRHRAIGHKWKECFFSACRAGYCGTVGGLKQFVRTNRTDHVKQHRQTRQQTLAAINRKYMRMKWFPIDDTKTPPAETCDIRRAINQSVAKVGLEKFVRVPLELTQDQLNILAEYRAAFERAAIRHVVNQSVANALESIVAKLKAKESV